MRRTNLPQGMPHPRRSRPAPGLRPVQAVDGVLGGDDSSRHARLDLGESRRAQFQELASSGRFDHHRRRRTGSGPGQWQEVTEEFRVPEARDPAGWHWHKCDDRDRCPTRDVRLQPIARLSELQRYRLDPSRPAGAVRGVHPRIYLNDRRIAQLRRAVTSSHQALFEKVRAQADRVVRSGPPSYVKDGDRGRDERLWRHEVGRPAAAGDGLRRDRREPYL